jgi:hypothetical protein
LGSSAVGKNVGLNNMGQLLSSGVSTGLTSLVNKLTGDDKLNIDVKYNNYSFSDQVAQNSYNRNQVKIGLSRPFLNDKLIVEVGSTSDWGKPVSTTNSSNFNITGDFRIQYILPQTNGIRLNAFRTSDYDVTLDKDITRGGVGISFRKSFDGLYDLFHNPGKTLPLPPKISEPSDSGEKREKARGGTQ